MTQKTIMMVTGAIEPSADTLVLELERRGARVARVLPSRLASGLSMRFAFDAGGTTGSFRDQAFDFRIEDVTGVWYRLTEEPALPDSLSDDERRFARRESRTALLGAWGMIPGLWVNDPMAIAKANLKFHQMQEARRLGLRTPKTLVTNDPADAERFYEELGGRMVFKTLSQGMWRAARGNPHVAPVTPDQLGRLKTLLPGCPAMFQQHIEKTLELRATVIGRRVFTAAIHSQESEATRHDWRGNVHKVRHTVFELPADVERKLLGMMDAFGLHYAAADFILSPEGEFWFLDFNPQGQFGWIEDMTGLPLHGAVADLLTSGQAG